MSAAESGPENPDGVKCRGSSFFLLPDRQRVALKFGKFVQWIVTANLMPIPCVLPGRCLLLTDRSPFAGTARMKATARRQVHRARRVAFEANAFALVFRIGDWDG